MSVQERTSRKKRDRTSNQHLQQQSLTTANISTESTESVHQSTMSSNINQSNNSNNNTSMSSPSQHQQSSIVSNKRSRTTEHQQQSHNNNQQNNNQHSTNNQQSTQFPPSKVLHVRGLPSYCTESELLQLCSPFGVVVRTLLLQSSMQGQKVNNTVETAFLFLLMSFTDDSRYI